MQGKKIFLCGGAGFIGSNLVSSLLSNNKNIQLTVFDNLTSGSLDFFNKDIINTINFIRGDIKDLDSLNSHINGHDCIMHLAANPDVSGAIEKPDIDFWEGTYLTQNILEAMRTNNISNLIYTSGSGVYGEKVDENFNESFGPCLPISTYGASKLACESLMSAYCHMYDFKIRALRFANVVGPQQTHGVGFDFLRRLRSDNTRLDILGDGKQTKSYIHILDVISAINLMLEQLYLPTSNNYDVFNVASNDYLSVNKIAEMVCATLNLNKENVLFEYTGGERGWKGDVPNIKFDCSKIKSLGWEPKFSSEKAMAESLKSMLTEIT